VPIKIIQVKENISEEYTWSYLCLGVIRTIGTVNSFNKVSQELFELLLLMLLEVKEVKGFI